MILPLEDTGQEHDIDAQAKIKDAAAFGALETEVANAIVVGEDAPYYLANCNMEKSDGLRQGLGLENSDAAPRENAAVTTADDPMSPCSDAGATSYSKQSEPLSCDKNSGRMPLRRWISDELLRDYDK